MPTILHAGPFRFYFFAHDRSEAAHVHVDRDDRSAKYWLNPIELARNDGFSQRELRRIERIIRGRQELLQGAWNEFFR